MTLIIHFHDITKDVTAVTGGKFLALARMANEGYTIPKGICISATAYDRYVAETGLRESILMELNRKDFELMRWEEMWDAALRIRNRFLNTAMPVALARVLGKSIVEQFAQLPVTVRSSAPGEDASNASFAGLHESYVNIQGAETALACVVKVWASLWSDAALLYRRELGLDPATASMAVVIQEMISGDRSGVAFGVNPNDETQAVVEAVYGLNQGLVDGTIAPDRWILERASGQILTHAPAERKYWMVPTEKGVSQALLPAEKTVAPPLISPQIEEVYETVMAAEQLFGSPQDLEWTFFQDRLYVLQSRPITTLGKDRQEDDRGWYLSLRGSFENLKSLRREIEDRFIPQMIAEAERLSNVDLGKLAPQALATEIRDRSGIFDHWVNTYWDEFIPFAHGARLFGQLYNDAVKPDDPHEFMVLLAATEMESLKRNQALTDLALRVRNDVALKAHLRSERWDRMPSDFTDAFDRFVHRYGDMMCHGTSSAACRGRLVPILLEMSVNFLQRAGAPHGDVDGMVASFLNRFEGDARKEASEILELARSSYRLRDDDNIHLGRIEGQLNRALEEGRERLNRLSEGDARGEALREALDYAENSSGRKKTAPKTQKPGSDEIPFLIKPRQLIGQPAGPGVASGPARVVHGAEDLVDFKAGEVLVCDAVDPNMTYVVPLCAAIVERRGGMLIHGAIIAREYGLPCVTGVPDVTRWIKNGDVMTVDGHLGIVIIGT